MFTRFLIAAVLGISLTHCNVHLPEGSFGGSSEGEEKPRKLKKKKKTKHKAENSEKGSPSDFHHPKLIIFAPKPHFTERYPSLPDIARMPLPIDEGLLAYNNSRVQVQCGEDGRILSFEELLARPLKGYLHIHLSTVDEALKDIEETDTETSTSVMTSTTTSSSTSTGSSVSASNGILTSIDSEDDLPLSSFTETIVLPYVCENGASLRVLGLDPSYEYTISATLADPLGILRYFGESEKFNGKDPEIKLDMIQIPSTDVSISLDFLDEPRSVKAE